MGVYNNNKDGTRSTLANTIQVVDAPMEQFLSRGEFSAVTPNDVSADNKLVAENEVTKAVDTMPTASADLVGTIVQYVGTTTANYTNGYFYKCVSDGAVTPTYSWVEVISGGGGNDKRYNVLDYGLKGDRTTDNTEALRNLIATIPNGSVIFFPVGTYVITEGIEINKDVTFLGENEEMQTGNTASNRIHDPMSIIKYGGSAANVTLFARANGFYDVNFVNLTLDGGNSYDVTDNWTATFTELPFYNQLETTNLAGINGLDLTVQSQGIVKNCMFWGFSGYGVKASTHKFIERCGFYKCKKGIETIGVDNLLHDLWFCKCGTAIYMTPKVNEHFASASISDTWVDQIIDHVIETNADVTSAQIITSNLWVDFIGKSAFYLPNAFLANSHIQGTFGRVGMDYAGVDEASRTAEIAASSDLLYCSKISTSVFELSISNTQIGKGTRSDKECFSRLLTTIKSPSETNTDIKVVCNKFGVNKLYDSAMSPYWNRVDFDGTDGFVSICGNAKYVNGFCAYHLSPVGRYKAPSKDFMCYDTTNKKLYRSTASDDNTAWVEVDLLESDPATDIDFTTLFGGD